MKDLSTGTEAPVLVGLVGVEAVAAVGLTVSVNNGQDTLITLADHSTILLKGVSRVEASFLTMGLGGVLLSFA